MERLRQWADSILSLDVGQMAEIARSRLYALRSASVMPTQTEFQIMRKALNAEPHEITALFLERAAARMRKIEQRLAVSGYGRLPPEQEPESSEQEADPATASG